MIGEAMDLIFSMLIVFFILFMIFSVCGWCCRRTVHGTTFTTVAVPQAYVTQSMPGNAPYPMQHPPVQSSPHANLGFSAYPTQQANYPNQTAPYPTQQTPYPTQQTPYPTHQTPYPPQQMPPQAGFVGPTSGPYPYPTQNTVERSAPNPPTYDEATGIGYEKQSPYNPDYK